MTADNDRLEREIVRRAEAAERRPPSEACLDDGSVVGFAEGRLPADEESLVRTHVLSCASCRARMGDLAAEVAVPDPRVSDAAVGRPWPLRPALVAAAVLLVAVGAFFAWRSSRETPEVGPEERLQAAVRALAESPRSPLGGFEPLGPAERRERPLDPERGGTRVESPRDAVLSSRPEVAWAPVGGATSYRVTVRDAEGTLRLDVTTPTSPHPWSEDVPPLAAGGRYVVKVRAITPTGEVAGSHAFRVLGEAERAAFEAGLAAIRTGAPPDLRSLLGAHLAARKGLWAEADRLLAEARREGAPSAATQETQSLVDHHLGRAPP